MTSQSYNLKILNLGALFLIGIYFIVCNSWVMIYKLRILSTGNTDFVRELSINADLTYFELHEVLVQVCNLDNSQLVSFFLSDQEWDKRQEVPLFTKDGLQIIKESLPIKHDVFRTEDRLIYDFNTLDNYSLLIEVLRIDLRSNIKGFVTSLKKEEEPFLLSQTSGDAKAVQEKDSANMQSENSSFSELDDLILIYGDSDVIL